MDASAIKSETPEQTDGRGHSGKDPSLADDVKSLWHELRELNHMQLQLAALEVQQTSGQKFGYHDGGRCNRCHLAKRCMAWIPSHCSAGAKPVWYFDGLHPSNTTYRYFKFTACSGSLADNK